MSIYDFTLNAIDGKAVDFNSFKGKVLLIVNVASKCGLTPQYESLEKLYKTFAPQGFEILGFPANQFASQEPGTNADIQQFCSLTYGVTFPMFEKIVVKGEGQHPLYTYLTKTLPTAITKEQGVLKAKLEGMGLLSGAPSDIMWNFEKFLVSRKGELTARFSPEIAPDDEVLLTKIRQELVS